MNIKGSFILVSFLFHSQFYGSNCSENKINISFLKHLRLKTTNIIYLFTMEATKVDLSRFPEEVGIFIKEEVLWVSKRDTLFLVRISRELQNQTWNFGLLSVAYQQGTIEAMDDEIFIRINDKRMNFSKLELFEKMFIYMRVNSGRLGRQ